MARRLAGIPGYQYRVDMSKEFFQRQIFNREELQHLIDQFQLVPGEEYRRHFVYDEKFHILEIKRGQASVEGDDYFDHCKIVYRKNGKWEENDVKDLALFLNLKHSDELSITEINEDDIKKSFNDKKFKELSFKDQILIKLSVDHTKLVNHKLTNIFTEIGFSILLHIMKLKSL